MHIAILGKKLGMTQLFTEEGVFVPVTVVEAGPCTVLRVLQDRVMLAYGDKKEKNISKAEKGFYKKLNVEPKAFIKELFFDFDTDKLSVGQQITVDVFRENDYVDITGISKGKGFQGGVKRWHWAGGPDGHGSMHHRRVGSIGASSFPSRVLKGQRLPGRMGNERKTVQNLRVVKVYKDKYMMLVKGPIPGANNGYLEIKLAKKRKPAERKESNVKPDTQKPAKSEKKSERDEK